MTLTSRTRGRIAVLLAAPALLFAFTACSATPSGTGSSAGSGGSGGSSGSDDTSTGSRQEYMLQFASCMRDNGVDMPDPSADGRGMAMPMTDRDALEKATTACQSKLGTPPPYTAEEEKHMEAEARSMMLKAAKCYRDNGVDVADPAEGELPQVPADAPEDVQQKCGFGSNAVTRVQK